MHEATRHDTDAGLYARSFGDVYDEWYGDLDDPAHLTNAFLERIEVPSRVLELGSGTGRLASPLHQSGYDVISVDVAATMLREAPADTGRICADMTKLALRPSSVDAALIAYNTLFTIDTLDAQHSCLSEAARVLRAGGLLAVEAFVAPTVTGGYGTSVRRHPTDPDAQLAIVTGPDPLRPDTIVGAHIELTATAATCRPWRVAYQTPQDLDAMAESAGLRLIDRHESWQAQQFDDDSDRHVSWYQRHP